jgi:cytochrome bd-type quinol oxidase subunit 2
MKYLQIANAAVLVIGAVMALNLAVVCLLYGVHTDTEPRLAHDLPRLYQLTGLFTALAFAGAAAFFGHRRLWPARWLLQALPAVPVLGIALFLAGLRS